MRAGFGRPAWKFPARMAREKQGRNVWLTSSRLCNCWLKPGAKKCFALILARRQRNWCWHETPGVARPFVGKGLCASPRRRQSFHLDQSTNQTEGSHSPTQRNKKVSGPLHLPQSFRTDTTGQLILKWAGTRRSGRITSRTSWSFRQRSEPADPPILPATSHQNSFRIRAPR